MMALLDLSDFEKAYENARNHVHHTPLLTNRTLSQMTGANIHLKAELFQKTGSYKIRGPLNVLANMSAEDRKRGLICSSAGNHAQGVAYAARVYGVSATVVMAANATQSKIDATRGYGAEVILHGEIWDDAYEKSLEIQKEQGQIYVHPFDNPLLIAGQGGVGLEILQDLPDVDIVVVPIGGGGLISGISMAIKLQKPDVKIIGVESSGAPAMKNSVEAGKRIKLDNVTCIIDGLVVKQVGEHTLRTVQEFVDEIVLVSDEEIFETILWVMERAKMSAEGAAVASVAALMHQRFDIPEGANIACVLSGGNLDLSQLRGLKWN